MGHRPDITYCGINGSWNAIWKKKKKKKKKGYEKVLEDNALIFDKLGNDHLAFKRVLYRVTESTLPILTLSKLRIWHKKEAFFFNFFLLQVQGPTNYTVELWNKYKFPSVILLMVWTMVYRGFSRDVIAAKSAKSRCSQRPCRISQNMA